MQQQIGPTIVLQSPPTKRYPIQEKAVYGLGVTIVISGILCILLQIAGSSIGIGLGEAGTGIWCGRWFIVTGSFGISAARGKTMCKIVSFMVLSTISASIFAVTQLTIVVIGLGIDNNDYSYHCDGYYFDPYYYNDRSCSTIQAGIGLNSALVILAVLIGILSIIGSAFSCGAFCCRAKELVQGRVIAPQTVTAVQPYVPGQPQVVVMIPSQTYPGHYMLAQNQAVVDNRINSNTQQPGPPSYDNLGYGAYGPSTDYPAVHQPTNTTVTPHETKTDVN